MEFRLLGPLDVRVGDGPLPLGGVKQRALLAVLLLNANRVVARERLIDTLWAEAPETAVKSVQLYVSQLRKMLPAGAIATRAPGYVLEVDPDAVDLFRFERLVAEARAAEPARAAQLLCEALELWRGPALAELGDESYFRAEAARLEELRLAALEQRIEAELALGHHAQLVGELEALTEQWPHRERLRGLLMLALYRCGRQAEALEAYRDARAALDELGLEPSATLRELEQQILNQDETLELRRETLLLADERVPLPGPLVPTPPFPFVGRGAELEKLHHLLARAEAGEGSLVLLAAEAGGGKTRLIRELAHEAADKGALVLYGVSDAAVTTPYQPLREWLEFLVRVCEADTLRECLGAGGTQLARVAPELAPVTGPPAAGGEVDRHSLHGTVIEFLTQLGRPQPLLLAFDDVHWADGETLQLLRRLARTSPAARWLIVAAYRREETPEAVVDLARLEGVTRLTLANLSTAEVGEFIREAAEAEAPVELANDIEQLTSGMPLFVCELWRELRDRGLLDVGETVRLAQPVSELHSPEQVASLVAQRLGRLDPETAALLELAAVAGSRFQVRLLAAAARIEVPALVGPLAALHRSGMLDDSPAPVASCRFSHELVRRAVYDRITSLRRAQLHLQVADALEQIADPDSVLPELAHHFALAVPLAGPDRAVDYNLRAGRAATKAGAYSEAAMQFRTALELGVADPRERIRVQLDLALMLRWTGGSRQEASALLTASLAAATALDESALAARGLVEEVWVELSNADSDRARSRAIAEAAIETLTELGDARGLAHAWRILGLMVRRDGRTADAYAAFERSVVNADRGGDHAMRRLASLSIANALCVGPKPVNEAIPRCEQLLHNCDDRESEADTERFLSVLYAMAARFDEALELVRRSSAVLDELGHPNTSWMHRFAAADTRELVGDRAGAEHELTAEWLWRRDLGVFEADRYAMMAACRLALFYCDEGRFEDAALLLEYGREMPMPSHFLEEAVLGLAARARVAAYRGQHAEAVALARRGVELADKSDRLNLRARIWLALAEVERARSAEAESDTATASALALYIQKGNVAASAGLRTAELATADPPSRPRPSR
jgi:DNA-binding SARP family transcriptional activator/tetratricopeptide (TPR) repeat protein